MSGAADGTSTELAAAADAEKRVAGTLLEAAEGVSRTECLDAEQRAEVYAILDAIQTDTEQHQALVALLKKQLNRSSADA